MYTCVCVCSQEASARWLHVGIYTTTPPHTYSSATAAGKTTLLGISFCNTLQHTATDCNPLQDTAAHCNTLQYTATHRNALQRTATHCSALQHTHSPLPPPRVNVLNTQLWVPISYNHLWFSVGIHPRTAHGRIHVNILVCTSYIHVYMWICKFVIAVWISTYARTNIYICNIYICVLYMQYINAFFIYMFLQYDIKHVHVFAHVFTI